MAQLFEAYNTGEDGVVTIVGVYWRAMTFTPTESHKITSVKARFYLNSNPTVGTMTVSIRATDGSGLPTGADLTSGTMDGNTITETAFPGGWYEVPLTPYALSAGVKYAIVIRAPNCTGGDVRWMIDNSSPTYAGGNGCYSNDSGATWSANSWDMMFEEWGTPLGGGGLKPPISVRMMAVGAL